MVIVLAVSGLLPLTVMSGFCAAQSCCRSHAGTASVDTNSACCDETNCDTSAQQVRATSAKTATVPPQLVFTLLTPSSNIITAQRTDHLGRIDTGPPPTRQRLATLSILLI